MKKEIKVMEFIKHMTKEEKDKLFGCILSAIGDADLEMYHWEFAKRLEKELEEDYKKDHKEVE